MLESIKIYKRWIKYNNIPEETTLTAVVQATSLNEARECYEAFKNMGYKKIAFSYGASFYNDLFIYSDKNIGKALGRVHTISILYKQNIIKNTDRIHLLGSANVSEFRYYKNMPFIESIDTSNPIMAAIDGIYYSNYMHDKPKSNMNNSFNIDFDSIDIYAAYYNINEFRKLIK